MKVLATMLLAFAAGTSMAQPLSEESRRLEQARIAAEEAAAEARRRQEEAAPRFQHPILRSERSTHSLYDEARSLERLGSPSDAVAAYIRAARAGSGKAARRLAEIYDQGIPGITPSDPESLRWYNAARALGEDLPLRKPSR